MNYYTRNYQSFNKLSLAKSNIMNIDYLAIRNSFLNKKRKSDVR